MFVSLGVFWARKGPVWKLGWLVIIHERALVMLGSRIYSGLLDATERLHQLPCLSLQKDRIRCYFVCGGSRLDAFESFELGGGESDM